MTTLVINAPKQQIAFTLPTTYSDGVTPLPPGSITAIKITVGPTPGGPYPKTVMDTALAPDVNGVCTYAMASLGVDLTKPNYAVLYTEAGGESQASAEVGFQNLLPGPPQAVKVQ